MDRINRSVDANELYIGIKRPDYEPYQYKWSEETVEVACCSCGSTDISSSLSDPLVVLVCNQCNNYDYIDYTWLLGYTRNEMAQINTELLDYFDETE